jgi:hypothetical protein
VREQDISLTIDLQEIIEKEEKNKKDQTTKKTIKHELLSPQQYKSYLQTGKRLKIAL